MDYSVANDLVSDECARVDQFYGRLRDVLPDFGGLEWAVRTDVGASPPPDATLIHVSELR